AASSLPRSQDGLGRFASRVVVTVIGRRRWDRPVPPEEAAHPRRLLAPNGERRLIAISLLRWVNRAAQTEVPRLAVRAVGALVADLGEDQRLLARVGEVLNGGDDVLAEAIRRPRGDELRDRGVILIGQVEIAVEADQFELIPERDRGELVGWERRVG